MADQHIELHERAFLHSALGLLMDTKRVQELEEAILFGTIPEIESIELSLENSRRVMESLINVATIDRNFDEREVQFLRRVGESLGMEEKYIKDFIKLGHTRVQQFRATQLRAPNVRARV